MSTVRFEQVVLGMNNQDKIEIYKDRLQTVLLTFSKNTLLQLFAMDLYMCALELRDPLHSGDYSEYLFKKLDDMFCEFEDLQSNDALKMVKENLIDAIQKRNELNKQ